MQQRCSIRWWSCMKGTTTGLSILSWYLCIQNSINKMHLCLLSIKYAYPNYKPTTTMGYLIHNIDISKRLIHISPCLPSALCRFMCEWTPPKSARHHWMWALTHSSQLQQTTVSSRPQWEQTCRWAFMRQFRRVCAEIAALAVAGVRQSWRWRCWMWRSCAGMVTLCNYEAGWIHCEVLWITFGHDLWHRNEQMMILWATLLVDILAVGIQS